jgi:plastocyanin
MDATNGLVLANTNNITLPKSYDSIVDPVEGMMRYNNANHELEIYQGSSSTWRAVRYKESTGITQQSGLCPIDGLTYYYGKLTPTPPSTVQTGSGSSSGQFSTNVAWGGQNILVFIGNVFQIHNTNYVITQNPNTTLSTTTTVSSGTTLEFASTSSIPQGATVTGSANIPPGTTATVTSATEVTLSNAVTGTVSGSTSITFAKNDGYYLNFTSDPNYSGMIGQPITVLHGFDQ